MPSVFTFVLFLVFRTFVYCFPVPLGVSFSGNNALPVLTLPYAQYRAASYNSASDIYIFKNIRFAAPPLGDLRWAKPAPPLNETQVQDGSYGNSCVQAAVTGLNLVGPGNNFPIGAAANQFLGGIPLPLFSGGNEDCLFLDVYVPAKAVKNPSMKLPVVAWIFGGAYVFGSKDSLQPDLPFYDGSGMIGQANNEIIFVAMNYRIGAYGFLAGTTMEEEGTPNAGFWDQRAALQWIQDYISLLGGDPTRVTAMGQSAGAGSIMHHLVAKGGKLDPLFSKAILQSPAFEMMWDRAGAVEDIFNKFAAFAGCKGQGLSCLRAASSADIAAANTAINTQQTAGSFAVGPTPDGSFIRQSPALELATGNFWPIESLVLSHVAREAQLFVSGAVQTDQQFSDFLVAVFPNYTATSGMLGAIASFYPPLSSKLTPYRTQSDRFEAFIRDSCFTCNIRFLTEALGDAKVWNMQYSVTPGFHGTDLLPTFFNTAFVADSFFEDVTALLMPLIGTLVAGISRALLSYFTSYIVSGDPNTSRKIWNLPPTVQWNHPNSGGEQIANIVNIGNWGFGAAADDQNKKSACDFWRKFAAAVTAEGGYAPPGVLVSQDLVQVSGDSSARYVGGNAP